MTEMNYGVVTSFTAVKGAKANFIKLKILLTYNETKCYKHKLTFVSPIFVMIKNCFFWPVRQFTAFTDSTVLLKQHHS
jgi:hypothetical protein